MIRTSPRRLGLNRSRSSRSLNRLRPTGEMLERRALLSGATITVSNDPHHPADYSTIQGAVDHAGPGDTVLVFPGTYHEQVTIPAADQGLTLRALVPLTAIVAPPPTVTGNGALIEDQAQGVTITGFTITGPAPGPPGSLHSGVLVDMGGSATIVGNHITKIADSPLTNAQTGIGIIVGGALADGSHTTGTATITLNAIDGYQKGGIVVDGAGSSANISLNVITGAGPTSAIGQNGVQISSGASGVVSLNVITGNVYTPQTFIATGVLLVNPGTVKVAQNWISSNDVGIDVLDSSSAVTITQNFVSNGTFDGIDLVDSTGVKVDGNRTFNNKLDGILLLGASTGNTVSNNQSTNNGNAGIEVDVTATGNTFDRNNLRGNVTIDAQDFSHGTGTAGTANTWTRNRGRTSNPPGLVS